MRAHVIGADGDAADSHANGAQATAAAQAGSVKNEVIGSRGRPHAYRARRAVGVDHWLVRNGVESGQRRSDGLPAGRYGECAGTDVFNRYTSRSDEGAVIR